MNYNIEESYRYSFGIISHTEASPVEVILSFDPQQGKYIKSLPLHETQEIIIDNEDELRISLTVHITHDFIIELLSYGGDVKVIAPIYFAEQIKEAHFDAYKLYDR